MLIDDDKPQSAAEFWESLDWDDRPFGCTRQQIAFAKAFSEGHNGQQSAILAGYSESGAAVAASHLKRNPKVIKLLKMASQAEAAAQGEVVTSSELLALWSTQARTGSDAVRMKSQELLARYHLELNEKNKSRDLSAHDTLSAIASFSQENFPPFFVAAAICQAAIWKSDNSIVDWKPPQKAMERLKLYPALLVFTEEFCAGHNYKFPDTTSGTKVGR